MIKNIIQGKVLEKYFGYSHEKNETRFTIIIKEGKNRHVRKMISAVKLKLLALHRNRIGFLDVKNIKQGKYVKLDENIVNKLKKKN